MAAPTRLRRAARARWAACPHLRGWPGEPPCDRDGDRQGRRAGFGDVHGPCRERGADGGAYGARSANEGQTKTYTYTVSDPGEDPTRWSPRMRRERAPTSNGWPHSFDCTFPDGPKTRRSRSRRRRRSVGNTGALDPSPIANVAPTVTLTGDDHVQEGERRTIRTRSPIRASTTRSRSMPVPGLRLRRHNNARRRDAVQRRTGWQLRVQLPRWRQDRDGQDQGDRQRRWQHDDSENVVIVTIANVAPVVTAAANSPRRGRSKSFILGSFTDPGSDADWDVSVDWGDGTIMELFMKASAGSLGSAQFYTYADGPDSDGHRGGDRQGQRRSVRRRFDVAVGERRAGCDAHGRRHGERGHTRSTDDTVTDVGDDPNPTITEYPRRKWTRITTPRP